MKTERKSDEFEARQIVRGARKAALATIDLQTGSPYVSLAAVATLTDGRPITLISTLARHTRNLLKNPAASLLYEIPATSGGVMAGSRVTLSGQMTPCHAKRAIHRYLARHNDARDFADFSDFGFFQLQVAEGHFIAAFGRIQTIDGEKLTFNSPLEAALAEQEAIAIEHINKDYLELIQGYCNNTSRAIPGKWRAGDIDREGISLVSDQGIARIIFPKPLNSLADLEKCLVDLEKGREKFQTIHFP